MKKFIYRDNVNKHQESNAFEVNDHIYTYNVSFGKPILTRPDTGLIDSSLLPLTLPASSLQLTKIASEAILAGDCVIATSDTHVGLATYDSTKADATVFGIATNDADPGDSVIVVLLGVINNSIFNIFPVNTILFLDQNGAVRDDKPPAPGFLTNVGKSLGNGYILVSIGIPTQLV